jgi:hypothetical protein
VGSFFVRFIRFECGYYPCEEESYGAEWGKKKGTAKESKIRAKMKI